MNCRRSSNPNCVPTNSSLNLATFRAKTTNAAVAAGRRASASNATESAMLKRKKKRLKSKKVSCGKKVGPIFSSACFATNQQRSFADIVREKSHPDNANMATASGSLLDILERGEGAESGASRAPPGDDFVSVEDNSVRSVLRNMFQLEAPVPVASSDNPAALSRGVKGLKSATSEIAEAVGVVKSLPACQTAIGSHHPTSSVRRNREQSCTRPPPLPCPMPPSSESLLANSLGSGAATLPLLRHFNSTRADMQVPKIDGDTDTSRFDSANVFGFHYNLSELLYETTRRAGSCALVAASTSYPRPSFYCPQCGETTSLEICNIEKLGSIGDRSLTNIGRQCDWQNLYQSCQAASAVRAGCRRSDNSSSSAFDQSSEDNHCLFGSNFSCGPSSDNPFIPPQQHKQSVWQSRDVPSYSPFSFNLFENINGRNSTTTNANVAANKSNPFCGLNHKKTRTEQKNNDL